MTSTAPSDTEVAPDEPEDVELDSEEIAEETPVVLPDPPAAPVFEAATYPDPSTIVLAASGRPISLYPESELDTTTTGVTADTIVIGGLVAETLAGAPFRSDACVGARARFEQANFHSELTREIIFDGCYDDAGQTELSSGLSQVLLRDGVFAVVPLATPGFAAETTFTEARVPYIGDEPLPGFCGRDNFYGLGTHGARSCPVVEARGFISLIEPVLTAYRTTSIGADDSTVVYAVEQSAGGEAIATSRLFEADLLGSPPPTFLTILPTGSQGPLSNWTVVIDQILPLDPEVLFIEGTATDGLPAALRARGYRGELVLVGIVDPLSVRDPEERRSLAPLTVITPGVDLANRASLGWENIAAAAAAIGVLPEEIGSDFMEGYFAADLFVRVAADTPEPFTAERFANTVNEGWWYPGIAGVVCGSWWPASHVVSTPCVSVAEVTTSSPALVPVLGLVETQPQVLFDLDRF